MASLRIDTGVTLKLVQLLLNPLDQVMLPLLHDLPRRPHNIQGEHLDRKVRSPLATSVAQSNGPTVPDAQPHAGHLGRSELGDSSRTGHPLGDHARRDYQSSSWVRMAFGCSALVGAWKTMFVLVKYTPSSLIATTPAPIVQTAPTRTMGQCRSSTRQSSQKVMSCFPLR